LKKMSINPALIAIMIPNLTTSIKNWLQDFPEAVVEIRLKRQILMEEIKIVKIRQIGKTGAKIQIDARTKITEQQEIPAKIQIVAKPEMEISAKISVKNQNPTAAEADVNKLVIVLALQHHPV